MDTEKKKVGIFGGSFDPPHVTHVLTLASVGMKTDLDRIIVLPTPSHHFKEYDRAFRHRSEMVSRAFEPLAHVSVKDWERKLDPPHYTAETLRWVQDRHPNWSLHFIIGGDLVEEVPQWEQSEELTDLARIIVIPRQGYPIVDPPDELGDFKLIELGVDLPEASSTKVRRLLERGADASRLLPDRVNDYIREQGLYQKHV